MASIVGTLLAESPAAAIIRENLTRITVAFLNRYSRKNQKSVPGGKPQWFRFVFP